MSPWAKLIKIFIYGIPTVQAFTAPSAPYLCGFRLHATPYKSTFLYLFVPKMACYIVTRNH